jgi:predicted lipid-binding transport protein (Tim44 family)
MILLDAHTKSGAGDGWSSTVWLILLVVLAGLVLYQLYSVLGRRVGRQADETVRAVAGAAGQEAGPPPADAANLAATPGLAAIKTRDPSFDVGRFLQGARVAYEAIVRAFAAGDREALAKLVTPSVMTGFETAMAQRESEGRSQTTEMISPPRADLDNLEINGDVARARVRFLAELRIRSKGPEGETVDDQRTAELWTFERRFSNPDPNWTLARVDAAEA